MTPGLSMAGYVYTFGASKFEKGRRRKGISNLLLKARILNKTTVVHTVVKPGYGRDVATFHSV
jgi:hypothetical protein